MFEQAHRLGAAGEVEGDAGADVLLHAFVQDVTVVDGRVTDLVVATKRGLVEFSAGTVVDAIIDPVGALTGPPESYYIGAAKLGGKVADRQRYGDAIDSILYESADSYAQMRLIYLQNRHFELGIEDEADVFDPYEDPYAQ